MTLLLALALFCSAPALAVPTQMTHTGRVFDTAGVPIVGVQTIVLKLYDAAGVEVWTEDQTVDFDNGYFVVDLGAVTPLDDSVLDQDDLSFGLTIYPGPELARLPLRSVPFARRAGTATNLSGGTIDAFEIRVDGKLVVDSSGDLAASALGDTLGNLNCAAGNQVPLFDGMAWSCVGLDWSQLGGVPADFADGADDDLLASIACTDGQILVYSTAGWSCGDDQNTQADLTALDARVTTNASDLAALDASLSTVAKSGKFLDLLNLPGGLADGDDDTQLDAATVVSYVDTADHFVLNTGDALTGGLTVDGGLSASGGLKTDVLQVGSSALNWSGRFGGRGDGAADDLWWIGDILPSSYWNAGVIIEICNGQRWYQVGCSSTVVSFGRYAGGASGLPGEKFVVEQRYSTVGVLTIPIRVSYGAGSVGQRPLKIWAEAGTTSGAGYQNINISVRGIGGSGAFTPGDFSMVSMSSLTLEN